MYIGQLNNIKSISFTHKATDIPFPPSSNENCIGMWKWDYVYDNAIDVRFELEFESYIGAVCLLISDNSATKVEILVDGVISGSYRAETGKCVGGKLDIPIGKTGESITVRLYTCLANIELSTVEILGAHDDGRPLVWPTPKSLELLDGFVKIKDIVSKNGDPDEIFAAEFLKERLSENFGAWQSSRGTTIVFDKNSFASYDGERYTVKNYKRKTVVSAKSRLTLLYGADTLLQMFDAKSGLRRFNCDDKPAKEFRGFHTGLPNLSQFEFMRRLFRYVLVPMRYNTLFVQVSACMRYDKHPEITEAWQRTTEGYRKGELPFPPHYDMLAMGDILEKDDVRRYVGYARELGLEIVPEIQSLGHVQYITLAHPELAEIDERKIVVKDTRAEDERPAVEYYHCYCPSKEESYNIILDIIDEVVDVIKPERYVHIGHDEIYQIGICKICREKDPAELMAEHINRLHDHIAEKGLGTMMWADMLQPPPARRYRTHPAIDKISKDIILLDFVWYFNIPLDIEDNLLPKGFKVGVGNLYSSHFPRYKSRITKKGMIGGQISMWIENSEETFGNNGKLWDMIFLSEMLWNTDGYDERNRRTYTHLLATYKIPAIRDHIRGKYNPRGYRATQVKLPKAAPAPADLKAICPKAITVDNDKIVIGGKYERLVFEHATINSAPRIVWVPINKIGDYILRYADGTTIEIPVKYAENIMTYQSRFAEPMPNGYYRHNGYVGTWFSDPAYSGKDSAGEDMTVGGFVWENPYPEKTIDSVTYRPIEENYCGLILAGIKGLNKR